MVKQAIEDAAVAAGLDPAVMLRFAEIESSLNPEAKSPGSKYLGLFQLTQAEFLEFGGGDIFDADDNARAAAKKLAKESARFAEKHGRPPTGFELYMIHQQGWSGYHALDATPGTTAWKVVLPFYGSPERALAAIAGNLPASYGPADSLTAGQFLAIWKSRLGFDKLETEDLWPAPWLALARAQLGEREGPGSADNADVVAYYRDSGHPEVAHDDVAWCAAFVGAMLKRAGLKPSGSLMARSYLKWGQPLVTPRPGCVVVLWRDSLDSSAGHVGFFMSNSPTGDITLLGGNQGDAVSIASFPRSRVLGYRWPVGAVTTTKSREEDMSEKVREIITAFAPLTPVLARIAGGPAASLAVMAVLEAVKRSGVLEADEDPAKGLVRLGMSQTLPILKEAEVHLETVAAIVSPGVVVVSPGQAGGAGEIPAPAVSSSPDTRAPELLTVFDGLFGRALVGWKTYIVIFAAGLLNGAAGLGLAPGLLTPDIVTAGNTALAALGGAALVSKVERYAGLAAGLLKARR